MASLVPGYEYDIFVSYRQKDNKYDGWVTAFVSNLKCELEATFKDEVSVYFDENQHDGLLETHNVDKSLEGKLKCLIFIPIISQTYCDPKSFAWHQEFVVFNSLARSDKFGMDIKLHNGNVASRILPVRIHDLDPDDKALFEKESGSVLRSVDFIYKSPGVNRPLRVAEDNPSSNQNKTFYRDQINKVANSIREIVSAILHPTSEIPQRARTHSSVTLPPVKNRKVLIGIAALLILAAVGTIIFFNIHDEEIKAKLRDATIAILPFENQTNNLDLNPIGQIAADFISTKLIQNQFLQVVPVQDVFRRTIYSGFVSNPQAEKKMISDGGVDIIVMGHYNPIPGDSLMLVASVNDVAAQKVLFTSPIIKCSAQNPMKAITDIQQFVVGFFMFSQNESNAATTRPPRYDAYEEYLKGMEVWVKNDLAPGNITIRYGSEVEKHFKHAIAIDQDFMPPYFKLMELFLIDRKGAQLDSLLKILDRKTSLFLEGDLLNYTILKFMVSKDWLGLEKFLLSKTNVKLPGFRPYYQLAVNSVYRLNKPQAALDYLALCDTTDFDFDNKPSDQLFYSVKTSALLKLRRHEEVVQLTSSLPFKIIASIRVNRWRSLYFLNKNETADKEVADFFLDNRPTHVVPHMALFRAALIKNDTAAATLNYHQFMRYEKQLKQIANVQLFVRAVMMFRMNDNISEAEKILSQDLLIGNRNRRIHQLGILYAVSGRPEKAKEVIDDMLAHENLYDNGFTRYYIAKIELALGNKDKSMDYLQQSLKKGMEFGEDLFEYDSDLKDLFDYPPFIELVKAKG